MYPPEAQPEEAGSLGDSAEITPLGIPGYTNIPENLRNCLKDIVDTYDKEEKPIRERHIRELKRADDFWHGLQYAIWDDAIGDFRTPNHFLETGTEEEINPNIFNKIKNIYKAHGESVISALTSGLPYVRYYPQNAENSDDVKTARAYSKIEELVQRQNQAYLLFVHALYILFNQPFVAAYNYSHQDKKYGQIQMPVEGSQEMVENTHFCPECGTEIASDQEMMGEPEGPPEDLGEELADKPEAGTESLNDEFGDPNLMANPPVDGSGVEDLPPSGQELGELEGVGGSVASAGMPIQCPECGYDGISMVSQSTERVPVILKWDEVNKIRECIEVYGPLNVTIPHYVTEMKHSPYIRLDGECHIAYAREQWPHIAEKIQPSTDDNKYDKWGRTPTAFNDDPPMGLVTVRRFWLRPWAFNVYQKPGVAEGEIKRLKELFPDGCYVVFVNDEFAEAYAEELDARWTVTRTPLSNFIHGDSLGKSLMPIQEVTNELLNLNIQSIQYGIPETFADPAVLDFKVYQKVEAGAGLVFPAIPAPGKSMQDAFFTNKVATLSKEAMEFGETLNQDGQFVVGSFPSIYGGPQSGGGQTAAEYSMSRAQALQRLGLTWKMLSLWWAEVMSKAVASYANNMMEDENFVRAQGDSYVNVWIRRVELEGKVGGVLPDVDEQFPTSWAQKREVLLDFLKLGNEEINQFLFLPANRAKIGSLIGLNDLEIPGEKDINKQLAEITEMLQAEAVMPPVDEMGQPLLDQMTGQPMQGYSSIPVDPDLDDHEIHAEVCKGWLNDDVGLELKKINPPVYMNIFLHFKEHVQYIQMAQEQQMQQEMQMAEFQSGLKTNEQVANNQSKPTPRGKEGGSKK